VDYGHGRPKGSLVLGLAAALVHGGSPVMEQWREEGMGSPFRASPGHGRRCGDWVTAAEKRRWWRSVWAALGHGKKRKRARGGVAEDGGALALL
jgi:hypothetical protein